jgi:hypothetical protein
VQRAVGKGLNGSSEQRKGEIMADEAKGSQCGGGDSMKTVQALGVILIVILGIFMVTSLNKVKAELIKMNQQIDVLVTTTAQNTLGGYQAVNEDGKLQWKFAPVPMMEMAPGGMSGPMSGSMGTGAAPKSK